MRCFRNYDGMRVLFGACLLGVTTMALTCISGNVEIEHRLIYRRVHTTGNCCDIVVSQWGRDKKDDDGSTEVRMEWLRGATNICALADCDPVVNSWESDLDADGKAEAVVVTQSDGSGSYGGVIVVAMKGEKLVAVPLPELSGRMAKGYEGHDEYLRDGNRRIVRIFPVRDADDRFTDGGRKIVYAFKNYRLVPVEWKDFKMLHSYWSTSEKTER
jgi:hypothetical protein